MGRIEICISPKRDDWKEFLAECSQAKVYHTPEWMSFLQETFIYRPCYIFARNDDERIAGMLPLFDVKGNLRGGRFCSVPFSHHVGPIGTPESRRLLINEALDLYKQSGLSYLEIRDYVDDERFHKANSFSTFTLDPSQGLSNITAKFWRDTRRNIKHSIDNGIDVQSTRDLGALKEFYELNCLTKRRIGVPGHSWSFFKNMLNNLDDHLSIYIGRYKGDIIGGGITLSFKDTIIYMYNATIPEALSLRINYALQWKIILDAVPKDMRCLDLGRVSSDNKGLAEFKKKWGAAEKKLYYSYFPHDPGLLTANRDNLKYRWGTALISRMPLPIYKEFSNRVLGYFG